MAQLVEMVVESVRVHMPSSQHVVILKELDHERYLPIWIGPWEANAIAMKLQGVSSERPLTHDLFSTTLDELGVTVRRVVISSLAEETFHAQLFLQSGDRELEVDSRPSDALALAVRAGVRIYAADEVLDRAGVRPEDGRCRLDRGSRIDRRSDLAGRPAPRRVPRLHQLARPGWRCRHPRGSAPGVAAQPESRLARRVKRQSTLECRPGPPRRATGPAPVRPTAAAGAARSRARRGG